MADQQDKSKRDNRKEFIWTAVGIIALLIIWMLSRFLYK